MRHPTTLLFCCSLVLILAILSCTWDANAAFTPAQTQIQRLYSARFLLSAKGEPILTVGLMQGRTRFSFSPSTALTARLYSESGTVQRVTLRPGRRYRVRWRGGQAARIRYWVSAFQTPSHKRKAWKRLAGRWRRQRLKVRAHVLGSLFGIKGRLLDNRIRLGVVGVFNQHLAAKRYASQLASQYGPLFHVHPEVTTPPQFRVQLEQGRQSWGPATLISLHSEKGHVLLYRVEYGKGYRWHGFQNRRYQGRMLFVPDRRGRIAAVNQIPISQYLRGVLPAEMPTSAPLEALKAQAVCARNDVLSKIGTRHRHDPFLFCDETHCQVYAGLGRAHPRTDKALRLTQGQSLFHPNGQLAQTPYSAICGGHTEHNEHVWYTPSDPVLRGKVDTHAPRLYRDGIHEQNLKSWLKRPPKSYCRSPNARARRYFRWVRKLNHRRLQARLHNRYRLGRLTQMQVLHRGISGRADLLQLVGSQRNITIRGELTIRRLFNNLPSSMFLVRAVPKNNPRYWEFRGGGWGHGVGLCQRGAMGRARAGQNYKQILQHYYSGVTLRKLY